MKLLRTAALFLIVLFCLGIGATALAATENWTADPVSGSKICIFLWDDSIKLVSANWSGPSADGKAEGKGTLTYTSREKDGQETKVQAVTEMKAGKMDGKASVRWPNGTTYEGFYKEGLRCGHGVQKSGDGTISEGEWVNDRMNGKGSLRLPDGRSFEGEFANGLPNGKIFYKMPDGRTYDGYMVNAVFQGKGVMKFPNGTIHDGDWVNGVPNGKGTLQLPGGIIYEGDFVNGQRTGKGVQRFPDGTRYEGEFLDSLFHGNGTLYGSDGKILKQGKWQKNEFAGDNQPDSTNENWVTDPRTGCKIGWVHNSLTLEAASWSGPVVDGKAEGQGTLIVSIRSKDGSIEAKGNCVAEMKAGKLDGKASIKWSNGDTFDGYFKDGWMEKGLYRYTDGKTYDGEYKNGKSNGYGILRNAAGAIVYEGEWKDDQPIGPLKADKVLGIPWGAAEDEADKIMLKRTNTYSRGVVDYKTFKQHVFVGPYNDELSRIQVGFYQGKMFSVVVESFASEEEIMNKFATVKKGLTARYGQPVKELGKYLDSKVSWHMGGNYTVAVIIQNEADFTAKAEVAEWHNKPFAVVIAYAQNEIWEMLSNQTAKQSSQDY